ncbi:MAG: hypothetical protein MK135_13370, partial [Polyangiaceae bacterium]|nr:hypothetical protein [Polyangiaceae bacterium]
MRAIVLIDHGSRREQANQNLIQLGASLERHLATVTPIDAGLKGAIIGAAHMELAEPTLQQVVDEVV